MLDEIQEDWKDKYQTLKSKGKRQIALLKDQIDKEIEVLRFTSEHEGLEKGMLNNQINREEQKMEEINR